MPISDVFNIIHLILNIMIMAKEWAWPSDVSRTRLPDKHIRISFGEEIHFVIFAP